MPIHEGEDYYELRPYGFLQTLAYSCTFLFLAACLIFLGIYYQENSLNWIFYVLAGIAFAGTLYYLVRRLVIKLRGTNELIIINNEGVTVQTQNGEIIQTLLWGEIDDFVIGVDKDPEYGTNAVSVQFLANVKEESIFIPLEKYATIFLKGNELASKIEDVYKSYKK